MAENSKGRLHVQSSGINILCFLCCRTWEFTRFEHWAGMVSVGKFGGIVQNKALYGIWVCRGNELQTKPVSSASCGSIAGCPLRNVCKGFNGHPFLQGFPMKCGKSAPHLCAFDSTGWVGRGIVDRISLPCHRRAGAGEAAWSSGDGRFLPLTSFSWQIGCSLTSGEVMSSFRNIPFDLTHFGTNSSSRKPCFLAPVA